jgi:hypothetical protein
MREAGTKNNFLLVGATSDRPIMVRYATFEIM